MGGGQEMDGWRISTASKDRNVAGVLLVAGSEDRRKCGDETLSSGQCGEVNGIGRMARPGACGGGVAAGCRGWIGAHWKDWVTPAPRGRGVSAEA